MPRRSADSLNARVAQNLLRLKFFNKDWVTRHEWLRAVAFRYPSFYQRLLPHLSADDCLYGTAGTAPAPPVIPLGWEPPRHPRRWRRHVLQPLTGDDDRTRSAST